MVGSLQFDAAAFDQVIDYALDPKNFHAGSHDRRVMPIVVATRADDSPFDLTWGPDGVASPIGSNGNNLGEIVAEAIKRTPMQAGLDGEQGSRTGYQRRTSPEPSDISKWSKS